MLFVLTLVYALNVADRFAISSLIEPIKAEFHLTDGAVGFLTGVSLAVFYVTAGLPLGRLADRANRRIMIATAVAAWSVMTGLCGLSVTYWQLLVARMGVGVGEAGGTPPSQSMIADYFPPGRRLVAMSIFSVGVPAGVAFGSIVASWFAENYGWRSGLLAFSLCGLPLVALVLSIREPKRGAMDAHLPQVSAAPPLSTSLALIAQNKSLVHVVIGTTIATFSGNGLIWWTPAFLTRSHGYSVSEAGYQVGIMGGLGGALATLASVLVMICLTDKPARWQCYFLAALTAIITVAGFCAFLVSNRATAIVMLWLFVPLANVYVGPSLALIQSLTVAAMRGLTVAIVLFTANVANLVLAPQLIGWGSDALAAKIAHPSDSLRFALLISALSGLWAAAHFVWAVRTLQADLERAGTASAV